MMDRMSDESGFERRARAVLEESLTRVDARTRSRLNRARQAALEAASARRRPLWRGFSALPIAGAVAAAVLAVALAVFMHGSVHPVSKSEGSQPSLEVLDMLADDDSIAFMQDYDHSFYEWAAAQADAGSADSGTGQTGTSSGDTDGSVDGGTSG
jgi:anti-sigma-K factor RskA